MRELLVGFQQGPFHLKGAGVGIRQVQHMQLCLSDATDAKQVYNREVEAHRLH